MSHHESHFGFSRRQVLAAGSASALAASFVQPVNAADLIRQAERCFAAGAGRIEFGTPHGLIPEIGIRMIGEQVLPALRQSIPN